MTTGPVRKGPRQASRAARRPVRADDGNTYQVRIRRGTVRARPDDVQLDLDWGFVPMLLWRSLPVLMLRSEQISLVERFTLMAATELGALSAEELSALTALPQRAVRPLLGRLLAAGALDLTEDDWYVPTPAGNEILTSELIVVPEETVQDFAYLPGTDELLVLTGPVRGWRRRLLDPRLRPVLQMPVSEELSVQTPSQIVGRHLDANTAHWCPPDLSQVLAPPGEEPLGDLCPVFQAAGLCRYREQDGEHRADLTFRTTGKDDAPHGSIGIGLSGIDGLLSQWYAVADLVTHPAVLPELWAAVAGDQLDPGKVTVEEARLPRYAMLAPAAAVLELQRRGVRLDEEVGIRVETEQASVSVRLELAPADAEAAALFAVDDAAEQLRNDHSLSCHSVLRDAAARFGLAPDSGLLPGPERVRERLWELRAYEAVYRMRESDDFYYT